MTDLIKRLEEAEAGSRELDATLWYAIHEPDVDYPGIRTEQTEQGPREVLTCELGSKWADDVGRYTTSLDAALALAERVISQRGPIELSICGSAQAVIHHNDPCGNPLAMVYGNTPALALCIAVLKATDTGREA